MKYLHLTLLLVSCTCRPTDLAGLEARWSVEPGAVSFASAYLGAETTRTVTLRNASRVSLTLAATLEAPFHSEPTISLLGGESVELPVRFRPTAAGSVSRVLQLSDGARELSVDLSGEGLLPLQCTSTSLCRESAFEPQLGTCRKT